MRLSSTPINAYLTCPRKLAYSMLEAMEGISSIEGEALDFGSLGHLFNQTYFDYYEPGEEVEWREFERLVRKMPPGDYGSDLHLLKDKALTERVWFTFLEAIQSPAIQSLLSEPHYETEVDITPYGIEWGNNPTPCKGRIDLRVEREDGTLLLVDYKFRGSLKYAPVTDKDFRELPQFAYYAAVEHAHCPRPGGIWVQHVNILRDSGIVATYGTHYPASYLDTMVTYFNEYLVPEMEQVAKAVELDKVYEVDKDEASCWTYGRCPFYDRCSLEMKKGGEDLDLMFDLFAEELEMKVISDEAAPDPKPVPVPEKPVSHLKAANVKVVASLQEASIFTLGDLKKYMDGGQPLTEFKGIGKKTATAIYEEWESYWNDWEAMNG